MTGIARAEITVAADIATAFDVFTGEVNAWYRVDRHTVSDPTRPTSLCFEPFVGGRFVDTASGPAHDDIVIGTITAWEPPHRLVFVEGRGCDVEVSFTAVDPTMTRVRIEQRGIDRLPADVAEHIRQYGWHTVASWFAHHVESSHPDPSKENQPMNTPTDQTRSEVSFAGITPYLFYNDAAAMLQWYTTVFGWSEKGRWSNEHGVVQNAEMSVGAGELWLDGSGHKYFSADGSHGQWIGVWVDDVEAMHTRIVTAGVDVESPIDEPYGVRRLAVTDPEGYTWGFIRRLP
jgi:uncharacterized glyoxalase superfamily protein PhnB